MIMYMLFLLAALVVCVASVIGLQVLFAASRGDGKARTVEFVEVVGILNGFFPEGDGDVWKR